MFSQHFLSLPLPRAPPHRLPLPIFGLYPLFFPFPLRHSCSPKSVCLYDYTQCTAPQQDMTALTPGSPVSSTLPPGDRRLMASTRSRTPPRRPPAGRPHRTRRSKRRTPPRARGLYRWAVAPMTVPALPASCRPPRMTRRLRSTALSSSWGSTALWTVTTRR
jgi:hypothetical protein